LQSPPDGTTADLSLYYYGVYLFTTLFALAFSPFDDAVMSLLCYFRLHTAWRHRIRFFITPSRIGKRHFSLRLATDWRSKVVWYLQLSKVAIILFVPSFSIFPFLGLC
jgi:hypothetical protein